MENTGYTKPLYILPFDHRITFAKNIFSKNSLDELTNEERLLISEYKKIIYEGFKKAVQNGVPKESSAILVDEEFGDEILKDAKQDGFLTILTTEKSGQDEFELQYGGDFTLHIDKYNPDFVKVLLKYNPEDEDNLKKRELEKLKTVTDFCKVKGFKFLLEVLVIPSNKQLMSVNNSKEEFDNKLRPKLTAEVVRQFHQNGVEPDVWKLEGFDSKEAYKEVIETAREKGRSSVSLVILGRGENEEKVDEWLSIGKDVVGVIGFAVGRTVFWQSILDFRSGAKSREQIVEEISNNFIKFYKIFTSK